VLGFFSIPSSKLVGYALPALAPWCALLTLAIAAPGGRRWRWVMGGAALACLAIVIVLAWQAPKSHRAAALQLAAAVTPGDRVVMVDEYFYDLPFYADLRAPVVVASRWDDPELPRHDNWRKELYDAAAFAPARGVELLRPLAGLTALACGAHPTWFVVEPGSAKRVAEVDGAQRVYGDARTELWRAPARPCP
jgi:4-amino-4-deoxy-L-arabinose transferase-like glycosyltransferase